VNRVWSQAGIRFVLANPGTDVFTLSNSLFSDVATDNKVGSETADFAAASYGNDLNAIDVYFVQSIYDAQLATGNSNPFLKGDTMYLDLASSENTKPGVLVAGYVPNFNHVVTPGALHYSALGNQRTLDELGRTLAHELGHYLLNTAEHVDDGKYRGDDGLSQRWNLMVTDGDGTNRDLKDKQADDARKTMDPAHPDQAK
jgi:hypothetical protein